MIRLLVFLLAFLSACTLHAQDEDYFFDRAFQSMYQQKHGAALLYLDSLASLYGHDDISLYYNIMRNETFRPLHSEAQWHLIIDKLIQAKREVEDTLRTECPLDTAIAHPIQAEVINYKLNACLDIRKKRLTVDGTMLVDFGRKPYIDLALWGQTEITHISMKRREATYEFVPDSSFAWMEQAKRLRIYSTGENRAKVHFSYTSRLDSVEAWMAACDSNFVQLSMYMPWFPCAPENGRFTGDIDFSIDAPFEVTASGIVSRNGNQWHIHQPSKGFDFEIIAAPNLKRHRYVHGKRTFEIDYIDFADADVDSLSHACEKIFDYYCQLYGTIPEMKEMKLVLLPYGNGAVSRPNFIVANAYFYNEYLFKLMAHEFGHLWWRYAPTDNWLDWMNESFAEYSSLRAIQHFRGDSIFGDYISSSREMARHSCQLYGLKRDAPNAHLHFYDKGALLLYDLQQGAGEGLFLQFMHRMAQKHASTHEQLMRIATSTLGQKWARWIDHRLHN